MNGFKRVELWNGDGGGNIIPKANITVRRTAAIGDSLCASVVADRLVEMGYVVNWQTHHSIAPVMRKVPSVKSVDIHQAHCDVDLDRSYEKFDGTPKRREIHFHQAFFDQANAALKLKGIELGSALNCRPRLHVSEQERALAIQTLSQYEKPWTFICPGSLYFRVRQVPNHIWEAAAGKIKGTKFWLGLWDGPPGIVDLKIRDIDRLVTMLSVADLLISPDTGPMHMAAALGVQVLAIAQSSNPEKHLSDLCDFETIGMGLDCENCCLNLCPKGQSLPPCQNQNPDQISEAANRKLNRDIVSCVIPTFNAPAERLNRCLEAVLPQVDEIIVTADAGGRFPARAMRHPKIRYLKSSKHELGFGKNCNYGIRHSSGSQILLLNDDCFVNPDCVSRLKDEARPDVGLVAHLLRYESGRIYFAGRQRSNGERGCPHIDHNQWLATFQEPRDMEAVSATSLLINREAFYKAKCFDEEFFMYAEDDCLSLAIRQQGYRIRYTPHATGIHQGNATTGPTGNMHRWIAESGKLMEKRWGWYWDKNKNTIPGTF